MVDENTIFEKNSSRVEKLRSTLFSALRKRCKLDEFNPRTKLGKHAYALVEQVASLTATLTVVTTYTNSITSSMLPPVTFTTTPSATPGISNAELQTAYETFESQWAAMVGTALEWANSNANNQSTTILSQLTSVPGQLVNLDGSVQYYLNQLGILLPGSEGYDTDLNNLTSLINGQIGEVQAFETLIENFSTSMETQTDTVVAACTTGCIAEIIAAYQTEIDNLNTDIDNLNDQINTDNTQLILDYVVVAEDVLVIAVGTSMIWNPIGWLGMATGAVGIYQMNNDISALNAEIAADQQTINTETNVASTDTSQVSDISAFANSVQGYTLVNATAQQELTTLVNLYDQLITYLQEMTADLDNNDISDASTEWTEILQAASQLSGITTYIWPSARLVYSPSAFAITSTASYAVTNSGTMYSLVPGGDSWTEMPDRGLSVIAADDIVLKINGQPANGSQPQTNSYNTDYCLHSFQSGAWQAISTFPVANMTTDGTNIYCIKQTTGNDAALVYKFNSGTSWSALPGLPVSDAPKLLTVVNGFLFATMMNSGALYKYGSGTWSLVTPSGAAAVSLSGNASGYVGYIDQNRNAYLYNTTNSQGPELSGTSMIGVAQSDVGIQYLIDSTQALSSSIVSSGNYQLTPLKTEVVSIYADYSNGTPVYGDNLGNIYVLSGSVSASNNSWTMLPAINSGS